MGDDLEDWACAELDNLGLPDAATIIQYLKPLEDRSEVENFLTSMLDITEEAHCKFIEEFLNRQEAAKIDSRFYRKSDLEESKPIQQNKKKTKDKNNGQANNNHGNSKKNKNGNDKENLPEKSKDGKGKEGSVAVGATASARASANGGGGNKKKTKYVNLYADDQDVVLLSGRHVCDCLASKHKLINNCLFCGRIVCEQEGAGPCFFCDKMVQTKADRAANGGLVPDTDKLLPSDKKNKSKVTVKDIAADIQKAVEHKNKLLEFDRTSEKRTKVFDDECDYFDSSSRWHSKANREKLQMLESEMVAKKYDRSENKITIDLLGRKIVTDETASPGVYGLDDPALKAILEDTPDDIFAASERCPDAMIPIELPRPVYTGSEKESASKNERQMRSALAPINKLDRLQDSELQEMSDQGKCLSMHQPWASLLIAGIKKHEGRSWYSPHRGRLWIASTAKTPTMKDIESLENFYRMREDDELVFPMHYPPGCLLGCVDVEEVLAQEEYELKYPDGESDSPYVFICKNPQEMIFKFAMKGQHKIYNLDPKVHQAARKALK